MFPPHPSPPPLPVPPDPALFLAVLYAVPLLPDAKPLLTPFLSAYNMFIFWLKQEATEMSKHRWVWSLNLYVCWQPNNLQEVTRGNVWCAGLVYMGRFYFHLDKFVETCHNTQATCHNHILSQASTLMYATREVPNSVCRRLDQSDSERSDPRWMFSPYWPLYPSRTKQWKVIAPRRPRLCMCECVSACCRVLDLAGSEVSSVEDMVSVEVEKVFSLKAKIHIRNSCVFYMQLFLMYKM